jgi:uncharacterized protein involved in outer membrane biogenesis
MKALKILGIILVILIVLLVGGILYLNHYLQTPAFKQTVLSAARQALGSDVQINEINISLFGGVSLRGITIANPQGFDGQLLTAEAFVLRPRLLPLLRKRVEIEQLSVDKPMIHLARNEQNEWNYEKIGGPTEKAAPSTAPTTAPKTTAGGIDITLSKVALNHGDIVMLSEKKKLLVRVQNVDFSSSVNLTGNTFTGGGKARIETLDVGGSLFVRQLAAPVKFVADEVVLTPLSGKLADGTVSGEMRLKLQGGFAYGLNLQVKDANVEKLLEEAGSKRVMSGKLQVTANLRGTGGLPTIAGDGRAEIVGGTLVQVPLQNLLAALLQVPALSEIKFDQCLMEFSLTNNVMQTPVIRLTSPLVQITGKGAVSLADYTLNHDMTLALAKEALNNTPKEIRAVFTERPDGFLTLDFRVWGPYDSPQTDLKERIVRGATQQIIEKGLQKLLK